MREPMHGVADAALSEMRAQLAQAVSERDEAVKRLEAANVTIRTLVGERNPTGQTCEVCGCEILADEPYLILHNCNMETVHTSCWREPYGRCESCGQPADVRSADGSTWCAACDAAAKRLGYDFSLGGE